jgi:hypothetical protein
MPRPLPPFALAVVLVAAAGSAGQDAKEKKAGPSGVWTRDVGGVVVKIDFTPGKGTLRASVAKGDDGCFATCKYEFKDGVVKGEVTKVEEKGNFPNPPPVGFGFGFKWAATGDTAELSDVTGDFAADARPILEGEYTRVKGAKEKKK